MSQAEKKNGDDAHQNAENTDSDDLVYLLTITTEACTFCVLADKEPVSEDLLNVEPNNFDTKPLAGAYRVLWAEPSGKENNLVLIEVEARRAGDHVEDVPVLQAGLVRNFDLDPKLSDLYYALAGAVREQFADLPEAVTEEGSCITVRDIHPNGRHRPFLRLGLATVCERQINEETKKQSIVRQVLLFLHVGVMYCGGGCCDVIALDSKQFYIHPNDDVLFLCGLWKEGLNPIGERKGRRDALECWLRCANLYADQIIDDALPGTDSYQKITAYKKAITAMQVRFS